MELPPNFHDLPLEEKKAFLEANFERKTREDEPEPRPRRWNERPRAYSDLTDEERRHIHEEGEMPESALTAGPTVTRKELDEGTVYTFSNGLRISPTQVRLKDQTWAISHIKTVGISSGASGIGIIVCSVLALFFGLGVFASPPNTATVIFIGLALWCVYGVWASWDGMLSAQVWFKIGVKPILIFRSRDHKAAKRVKNILEDTIASARVK